MQNTKRKRRNELGMKLPTRKESIQLFEQYHVPQNIKAHCMKVSELATVIAKKLKKAGMDINVPLVEVGGLLHDWMKAVTLNELGTDSYFYYKPTTEEIDAWKKLRRRFEGKFKNKFYESDIAYELLKDKYSELAEFILNEGKPNGSRTRTWEEKLVHYADWRVMGAEIVPLKTRMNYFFERYKKNASEDERREWEKEKVIEIGVEKEICERAECIAEELYP